MISTKSKRLSVIAAATVLALATLILPASAHTAPLVIDCVGQATVTPGLTVLSDKTFEWSITVECDVDGTPTTQEATLEANGTAFGRCGRSVAPAPGDPGGTGTLTFHHDPADPDDDDFIDLGNIGWQSLGTVLAVSGTHDNGAGDGNEDGTLAAQVQASGGEDCAAEPGATEFDVNIAGELL